MASAEDYANWIVANQDKKGSPEFDTVAQAYKAAKQTAAPPAEENPTSLKNIVGAALEPMAHLASGAIAAPVAGLAGIGTAVNNALGISDKSPADVVRATTENMTYAPRTSGGRTATEAITYPLRKYAESSDMVGQKASDLAGPLAGTAVKTALDALPMFAGAKVAPSGVPAISALDTAVTAPGKAATGVGTAAYRVAEPALPWGPKAILDRYQRDLAGDSRSKIIDALQNAQELVPGSKPTAGEAIASIPEATQLAAHQKMVARTQGPAPAFATRDAAQEAARRDAIDSVAQDKAALTAAEDTRSGNAATNYKEAYSQAIKGDADLMKMSDNPYFKDAIPDATKLAEARGIDPKTNLTEYLHLVKLSLDKQLSKTGDTALSRTEQGAVENVKTQLVDWLRTKNPSYDKARAQFAEDSAPVNQMQVGQYLRDKLQSPLDPGVERAASFSQAIRDAPQTIKRSTGAPMYDELSQVLSPGQTSVVEAIQADLARKAQYESSARGTNLSDGTAIAANADHLPHLLSRPAMLANYFMRMFGESADSKINRLSAERYLDPQQLATALKDPQQRMLIEEIMRRRNPAIVGASTAAGERQ